MSRWHARLAEIRGTDGAERDAVQNAQNVQKPSLTPAVRGFEHFEQIEHAERNASARMLLEPPASPRPAADPDDLAERLAIQQWNAGLPARWADGIERLLIDLADRPRGGFTRQRWSGLIDDLLALHEAGWLPQLAALGWTAIDVFGCHRSVPLARLDCAGLLLLLDGRQIGAVAGDRAILRTSAGARQTFYRRPAQPGAVLLMDPEISRDEGEAK